MADLDVTGWVEMFPSLGTHRVIATRLKKKFPKYQQEGPPQKKRPRVAASIALDTPPANALASVSTGTTPGPARAPPRVAGAPHSGEERQQVLDACRATVDNLPVYGGWQAEPAQSSSPSAVPKKGHSTSGAFTVNFDGDDAGNAEIDTAASATTIRIQKRRVTATSASASASGPSGFSTGFEAVDQQSRGQSSASDVPRASQTKAPAAPQVTTASCKAARGSSSQPPSDKAAKRQKRTIRVKKNKKKQPCNRVTAAADVPMWVTAADATVQHQDTPAKTKDSRELTDQAGQAGFVELVVSISLSNDAVDATKLREPVTATSLVSLADTDKLVASMQDLALLRVISETEHADSNMWGYALLRYLFYRRDGGDDSDPADAVLTPLHTMGSIGENEGDGPVSLRVYVYFTHAVAGEPTGNPTTHLTANPTANLTINPIIIPTANPTANSTANPTLEVQDYVPFMPPLTPLHIYV